MCGRPPPHPSRAPSQGPRRCRQARGTPHSWGRFSSALGCPVAFQPPCPHLRDIGGAGAWVSPGPAPQQSQGEARATPLPQPQEAEETLGKSTEPFLPQGLEACHQGWGCHRAHQQGEWGRGGPDHTGPPSWACAQGTGSKMKPTEQLGQRHAGGARVAPKGHRPQEGRPWGLSPAPTPGFTGRAWPSDVLWLFCPPTAW